MRFPCLQWSNSRKKQRRLTYAILSMVIYGLPSFAQDDGRLLHVDEYHDKVLASWLGQIIGNTYGLSYEFKFIAEPGPDAFPYGYGETLARVREVNGAFSDDDTDIEYMYLLQMEQHGIEPSYQQLAQAWKHHVREKVWVANRQALALMHAGFSPPLTGHQSLNHLWFQIDPQLVNEIWAVTAPGMVDYAVAKTRWAARITSDDFGTEPAMFYAAMYSAAFFEQDIQRLLDIASNALPSDSHFVATVKHMRALHQQYPHHWQKARAIMAKHYFADRGYNRDAWRVVDANLNGACAILALLYGEGDFQKTLDYASAMGFDADNQAATLSGLLGIIGGTKILPKALLHPLADVQWSAPFNDRYINVSRVDLPDAGIQDMAKRMATQGQKVVLAQGGKWHLHQGQTYLSIPNISHFVPPAELPTAPILTAQRHRSFQFALLDASLEPDDFVRVIQGALPPGLKLQRGIMAGTPTAVGEFNFTLQLGSIQSDPQTDTQPSTQTYHIRVFDENLALSAERILHNEQTPQLTLLRDGDTRTTFYSRAKPIKVSIERPVDHYGYQWSQPQKIDTLILNNGLLPEFSGWFTALSIEYLNAQQQWQAVEQMNISPSPSMENTQWLKGSYLQYLIRFNPIQTRAIRVLLTPGGVEKDAMNGGGIERFTAISELSVYGPSRAESSKE